MWFLIFFFYKIIKSIKVGLIVFWIYILLVGFLFLVGKIGNFLFLFKCLVFS